MGKIIAVTNQKGGVGKTTTAVNTAAGIAKLGYKVLLIDTDPQGNATSGVGIDKRTVRYSAYSIMIDDVPSADAVIHTSFDNLDIIPSSIDLAAAELELADSEHRESKLKNSVALIKSDYDYIFIDCPPSLGLLTINSLTAVDSVLIPIQCEYYALEGVSQLMSTIEIVKAKLNPDLEIEGVILSMFDGRTNLSIQVVEEVKKYFREKVYTTVIPRNVRLAEAPSYGMPIVKYDPNSTGAEAYSEFADEFLSLEE